MSEYEILDLINATEYQRLNLLQWWGGITFGLIALAHFASERLNLILVILVLTLYVSFCVFMYSLFAGNQQEGLDFVRQLELMQAAGIDLSIVSRARIVAEPGVLQAVGYQVAIGGAFIGSIAYLVYAYWRSRAGSGAAENRVVTR